MNRPPLGYVEDRDMIHYGRRPGEERPIIIYDTGWRDGQMIRNRLKWEKKFIAYVICTEDAHALKHICNLLQITYDDVPDSTTEPFWVYQMLRGQYPTRCIYFTDEVDTALVNVCEEMCNDFKIPFEVIHHG